MIGCGTVLSSAQSPRLGLRLHVPRLSGPHPNVNGFVCETRSAACCAASSSWCCCRCTSEAHFKWGRAGISKESQKHQGESRQTGEAEVTKP